MKGVCIGPDCLEQEQWEMENGFMDAYPVQTHRLGVNMPDLAEMIPSKYLKQSDVSEDLIVTIASISKENVARANDAPEYKWLMTFRELDKPMVMNTTNLNAVAQALGATRSEDWIGKEVVLYVDPTIAFGGKVTGGLRLRGYKPKAEPRRARPAKNDSEEFANQQIPPDDDIPFN